MCLPLCMSCLQSICESGFAELLQPCEYVCQEFEIGRSFVWMLTSESPTSYTRLARMVQYDAYRITVYGGCTTIATSIVKIRERTVSWPDMWVFGISANTRCADCDEICEKPPQKKTAQVQNRISLLDVFPSDWLGTTGEFCSAAG